MSIYARSIKPDFDIEAILAKQPLIIGRSKEVYDIDGAHCLVRLIPSLTSYTYQRHEMVEGTEILRLDFFEMAVVNLKRAGVDTAFVKRVARDMYIAEFCQSMPFEVIVKNVAGGSTLIKYPGLFDTGYRFRQPVIKFDYRTDPEDQPIGEDYVREAGYDAAFLKSVALKVNDVLAAWLRPRNLIDFCLIFGIDSSGGYKIVSEISPDAMRLRSERGRPLDKDLFRQGASHEEILSVWSDLARGLQA